VKSATTIRWRLACRWGAFIALGVTYAVLAHRAAASDTPSVTGALIAITPLTLLCLVLAWRSPHRPALLTTMAAALALLWVLREWLLVHYHWVFLVQHAGIHIVLGIVFGRTLRHGQTPMIARFARIVHGELSPALARYTRGATWAWTMYFAFIALASVLLFLLAPRAVWSTFATLLGGPLLVAMFAAEYAVRWHVLPASERAGPLQSVRAWRKASADGSMHRS